ncbi:MAG: hypothetical protein ACT4NJ_03575 [Nitrosopumilaceae archaeon]
MLKAITIAKVKEVLTLYLLIKYEQLRAYKEADQGENHAVDRMARIGIKLINQDIDFLQDLIDKLQTKR